MALRQWALILGAEILTVPIVIFLFRSLDRKVAAVIAGSLFLAIGFYLLRALLSQGSVFFHLSFWAALTHLAFSLTLVGHRLFFWEKGMHEILIYGKVPGPVFHYYSEKVYAALIVATLVDLIWDGVSKGKKKPKPTA